MRFRRWIATSALIAASATALAACSNERGKDETGEGTSQGTGAALSVQVGDADVAGFNVIATRVSCNGEYFDPSVETFPSALLDLDISIKVTADGSAHPFADTFIPLVAGCYDIVSQPIQADGTPSAICAIAGADNVEVLDGLPTEITLISQCNSQVEVGAVDVISLLNRPPQLTFLGYPQGKFVAHCDDQEICATFKDPDGDPLEVVWTKAAGLPGSTFTVLPAVTSPDGSVKQCVSVDHAGPEMMLIEAKAYDKLKDPNGPGLITFEQFYQNSGIPSTSNDSFLFQAYGASSASCPCVPSPEFCDGVDNDCDGQNDEGLAACVCVPADQEACYSGPAGTGGVGVCAAGVNVCAPDGSGFGACQKQVVPKAEACGDALDNDCDGNVNEACPCTAGAVQSCYSGPNGKGGVGICAAGTQACSANGTWGTCMGSVLPAAKEVCGDQLDNDCDGKVDEPSQCGGGGGADVPGGPCAVGAANSACYTGPAGTQSVGLCKAGTMSCQANGLWSACAGQIVPAAVEIQNNGQDEKCNGNGDEGIVVTCGNTPVGGTQACYSGPAGTQGVGICKAGAQTCQANGQWTMCAGDVVPAAAEVCNDAFDNDCDGSNNENPPCPPAAVMCGNQPVGTIEPCYSGPAGTQDVGICKAGSRTCQADGQWTMCAGEVVPAAAEVCNDAFDNDCDGSNNENPPCPLVPPPPGLCLNQCNGGAPDGVCDVSENLFNCSPDCSCGDGQCTGTETTDSCPADCKFSSDENGLCGNGYCEPWEVNKATKVIHCAQDCKIGAEPAGTTCGDGNCSTAETSAGCPADCGNPAPAGTFCGDLVCNGDEHWSSCPDCIDHVDQGTFLSATCVDYALVAEYADGNGGVTSHTVTACAEGCGAYPWKLLAPNSGNVSINGATLLRPDCTVCTVTNAPDNYIVGDAYYGNGWANIFGGATYEMALDPNACGTMAYAHISGYLWNTYLTPVEWEKVDDKDCSVTACQIRDCAGNTTTQSFGTAGMWKPTYAPWSSLAEYCQ